nr:E-beta-farnesene synthase [Tanacetum cinerariifolium]
TLRDALQITPVNNNQAFTSPPSSDALINFVNELGYPKLIRNLSNVGVVNRAHLDYAKRIWEEFTQSIHIFIEDKRNLTQHTHGKKKATLIVISSIRFTKLIIYHLQRKHKFLPRPDSPLHLPNEEPVLGYLKFSAKGTKREVFGMPIPGNLITADIQGASYYQEYLAKVAKHQRYMASETGSDPDSPAPKPTKTAKKSKPTVPKADPRPPVSKPASSKQTKPKPAPAKTHGKKRKLVTEISDKPSQARKSKPGLVSKRRKPISSLRSVAEDIPDKEPRVDDVEADVQRALEESLKSMYDVPWGPFPPVVIREPESKKYQPLPEVSGKGKEKVTEEQVACDLLTLQTPKKKSPTNRYIFQRRTFVPTRSSGHDESSSLYAKLGLTDSEEESDEDLPRTDAGVQGEGQAGPNPDAQDEGQAGLNPDEQAECQAGPDPGNVEASQPLPNHVVHAGSDLEHMDLDVADVLTHPHPKQMDEGSSGTLSSLQHLTKDLSFGDLFFCNKPSEANNDKATAETEAESMASVTIQQDTSLIPPMTTPIIDLTSRPESPKVHQLIKATATETTTIHPPPSQQQQSTTDSMMMKRIGELEHIMANLIHDNKQLEQRLDSHGARLYTLEHLDIPNQVSKAVDEVVMDAVDWAMQAPLRNRFRDLPEADMKEILHQRMWETDSYKTHKDQMQLYEALEKSMNYDRSEELLKDLAEARQKKKKRRDSPKTPPGSPPHQPPPPPPPAGPSGASGSLRDSGSLQVPPPPPSPPSTNQEGQSKGSAAPSSSKTAASAEYQSWTMTDTRLRLSISLTPADLQMDEDMALDAQAQSSDDEYIGNAHIPKYQMEKCHKLLTDSVDNSILRHNVSKPLPLGGPPGQVTIQSDFFFNKDLEYLRYDSKGSRHVLSISKIKAAYYPDAGLEQMYDIAAMYGDRRAVRTHIRILSVVRIEVFSMYGYDYMKKIVLRRADLNEHVIA